MPTIHGKWDIHSKHVGMCTTLKKQIGGNTNTAAPNHSEMLQKFCRDGKIIWAWFVQKLQRLLKPIYDLTRKGRPFIWGTEQQDSFEEIKCRLMKPPALHMPNKTGRFHLYFDTSKFTTGSALYQIQNGKPKWIAYVSKRLLETAKSYSIPELELCVLAINIASFSHLLQKMNFWCYSGPFGTNTHY